jgi:hypothetical protein
MSNKEERDLINLLLIIGVSGLIVIIVYYGVFIFSKIPKYSSGGRQARTDKLEEKKFSHDEQDYKKIIEQSKTSYKDFMKKEITLPR